MPYISLRDYAQAECFFPALIGLDKKLLGLAEVQEGSTWVVDLDKDQVWKTPTRFILLQE